MENVEIKYEAQVGQICFNLVVFCDLLSICYQHPSEKFLDNSYRYKSAQRSKKASANEADHINIWVSSS